MPRYKRTFDDAELDLPLEPAVPPEQEGVRSRLRNMWQFSSLMQYIYLFGHVVKIDNDFDIEDLEAECLAPQPSEKLAHIGLQLLKWVSSHRGLTPDIFDEYTRRQYVAKAPTRNPYGEDEEPAKFSDFDVFTKIQVLQQLSTWTLGNADRMRSMMPQEEDQSSWRMEPIGWDKDDRSYFVLDDDRMYRRTDEPPPPPSPKLKPKSKAPVKKSKPRGTRASKRRKVEDTSDEEVENADAEAGAQDDTMQVNGEHTAEQEEPGFGFTGKTWECVAVTLEDYQEFLATIFRTRDPNEKQLRKTIEENVLPIIEKRAEALRQKHAKKIRELENLQKMATAKRSSRLADKAEKDKHEREEREAEEKKQRDLKMAHEEQDRQRRIEEGHESRRLTREQRLKEREVKRILHEEELAKIEDAASRGSQEPASQAAADSEKRVSERQMKTQQERHRMELERMAEEDEDNWVFDCAICGVHGENMDDGTHSIACERCNVWQHSKCHGFSPKQAEKDGFHFVCSTCKRKEADAKRPKIAPLKLTKKPAASPEVQIPRPAIPPTTANGHRADGLPDHITRQLNNIPQDHPHGPARAGPFGQITNGPSLSPYGQTQGPPGYRYPPVGNFAPHPPAPPQQAWQGSPIPPPGRPASSGYASSPPPPMANGYGHPNHHQQHHQYVHHNAAASSGGHPNHQAPHQPQMFTYSRGSPGGMYPMSSSPSQHPQQQHYYQSQQPPSRNQHSPYQQPHRPNSSQMSNGLQSPVKIAPHPSISPPQYGLHRQPPPLQQQPSHQLNRTPHANFPPPSPRNYSQESAQSPVKSSSPTQHYPLQQGSNQSTPHLAQTPQAFRPPSANGMHSNHHPPQQSHPSPASANANGVAADGMSGPWPEGSKAIPQKHDQSPAPLSSSQAAGEMKIVPPVAPLMPSPGQQMQAVDSVPQAVPVKKIPETNGSTDQVLNRTTADEKSPVVNRPIIHPVDHATPWMQQSWAENHGADAGKVNVATVESESILEQQRKV